MLFLRKKTLKVQESKKSIEFTRKKDVGMKGKNTGRMGVAMRRKKTFDFCCSFFCAVAETVALSLPIAIITRSVRVCSAARVASRGTEPVRVSPDGPATASDPKRSTSSDIDQSNSFHHHCFFCVCWWFGIVSGNLSWTSFVGLERPDPCVPCVKLLISKIIF